MKKTKKNSNYSANSSFYNKKSNDASRGDGLSVGALRSENDFSSYVTLLKEHAKRFVVFAVAIDTPCGPEFSREKAGALMGIGLKCNLYGQFRRSYAAIIDAGRLIFEKLANSIEEIVEYQTDLNGNTVELLSVGFSGKHKLSGSVTINGKRYQPGGRGLNLVVYDKVTNTVLDEIKFDTYLPNIPYRRPREISERLNKYKNNHPEIQIYTTSFPAFPEEGLTENEQFIKINSITEHIVLQNRDKPVFAISQFFDAEGIREVLTAPKSYYDIRGVRKFEDTTGRYVNTVGGHRLTAFQPREYTKAALRLGLERTMREQLHHICNDS